MKEIQEKVFEVRNPGPVKEFTLRADKGPGVYVLAGPNGVGKSSILRAIAKALGYQVPVNLRRGAKTLSVELDGQNLLETSKVKPTADIENALMKASPLARFILPGLSDDHKNETARNEAFFELVDIPVTEEAIRVLCQGNEAVFDFVFEKEGEGLLEEKIVDAADKVRRRTHELKREYEQEAVKAQADIDAHPAEKPAVLSKVSVLDAKGVYEIAVRQQERLRGQAEQREIQERQLEEIKQTQGERPDVDAVATSLDQVRLEAKEVLRKMTDLEAQLAVANSEVAALARLEEDAIRALNVTRSEQARWDRNRDLLGTPITGATKDDLQKAVASADQAAQELERARVTETYKQALQSRNEAQGRREAALKASGVIEKVATSVTAQLGPLFSEAGIENLTIEEGVLHTVDKDGAAAEPLYELSAGERTAIGCSLLMRNKFSHDTCILPGQFWGNLQPANKAEVATSIAEAGLYAYTEEPAEGELRMFAQPKSVDGNGGEEGKPKKTAGKKKS